MIIGIFGNNNAKYTLLSLFLLHYKNNGYKIISNITGNLKNYDSFTNELLYDISVFKQKIVIAVNEKDIENYKNLLQYNSDIFYIGINFKFMPEDVQKHTDLIFKTNYKFKNKKFEVEITDKMLLNKFNINSV